MKRIYIALSLVLAALCFASVETGFISGKTDSFIAKIECADRLMSRLEFEDALKICEETVCSDMCIRDRICTLPKAFRQKKNSPPLKKASFR